MLTQEDQALSYSDKLKLIEGIKYYQWERRKRIKLFWSIRKTYPAVGRVLIPKIIILIREQQVRLNELKKSINN